MVILLCMALLIAQLAIGLTNLFAVCEKWDRPPSD